MQKFEKDFTNIIALAVILAILIILIIIGSTDSKDKTALKMYRKCVEESTNDKEIKYCGYELDGYYER